MKKLLCALPTALALVITSAPIVHAEEPLAPVLGGDAAGGKYIVVTKSDNAVKEVAATAVKSGGEAVTQLTSVSAVTAQLTEGELKTVRKSKNVAYVEPDRRVTFQAVQVNPPSWGLDRIDQTTPALNRRYQYSRTGAGVNVYVVDTGVRYHNEFAGRYGRSYDVLAGGLTTFSGSSDCNGHGTHVAGIIGGATSGVAKGVRINSVKVLDCQGSGLWSTVIAGLDWVAKNAPRPAVVNVSIGGGASQAVNAAVARLTARGITVVAAAGNENRNACSVSPASAPSAITVGATTSANRLAPYSNWGGCLDILAPGSSIRSAYKLSTSSYATMSGTSMAAPHVAGVAAMYLQGNRMASAATVRNFVVGVGSANRIAGVKGSPNRFLYSYFR